MKKVLFLLGIIVLFSCKKEEIEPINRGCKCPELPVDFMDSWKWEEIKNVGGNWSPLTMGPMQFVTITQDSIQYDNQSYLAFNWDHLGCAVVSGISNTQFTKIEIVGDTMIVTGLNDLTEWKLSRN